MQCARLIQAGAWVLLAWQTTACASSRLKSSTVLYATEQGVGVVVSAPLEKAGRSASEAFRALGIQLMEVEVDDGAQKYSGTRRDLNIVAELTSQAAGQTQVEVTARAGKNSFDKVFAQKVLERIAGKLD
jgi:hypothetical protein